ncbi:MAG TPA: hypothetical protein VHM65_03410 [Candidatus Lustribacter sp.]|nr:hypothetical protein [Candidatus Lustribacter sp.]
MSTPEPYGDPASCSELGGTLRRAAARLGDGRDALRPGLAGLGRRDGRAASRVADELALLDRTIECLDEAGAALQRYATELAELGEAARVRRARVEAGGLVLEQWRVSEPWGPSGVDDAMARREAVPALQQQADQLHARIARARALLLRTVSDLDGALSRQSARVRQGLGR